MYIQFQQFRKNLCVQKNAYTFVGLFALWIIFLWDAFGSDRSFALFADNEFFIGSVLSSMSVTLGNGEWPLRMDTILGGVPLYNFTQISAFYPFYLTVLPIYTSPLDVIHSMHWITLIHLLIIEINMYLFIRVIGASRLAALTDAALVTFSANSIAYAVWMNIIAPYSWFPLYLAGLVGLLNCPRSIKYFVMALGGIVLLTLASPAQPLIHAVFVTIIFVCAFTLIQLDTGEARQIVYKVSGIITVAVLALLLVAPVILPATLEFKNMIRAVGNFPPVVGNDPIPFEAFQTDQLTIADLCGVFFKFKAAAVGDQFTGIIEIALASIAVVSRFRSWIVIALVFIAVYSLISSTGSNLGLVYVNYIIPMLNKIREPSRFLFLFQFAIGVLAALGIDELRKTVSGGEEARRYINRQWITLIVIAAIAVITLLVVPERIVSHFPPIYWLAIFIALIFMTWIMTRTEFRGRAIITTVVWSGTALTLLAIEVPEVPWIPIPIVNSQYLTSGALALDMAIERVATLDPKREYRTIFDGKIDKQQAAMLASYRRVRTLNANFNPVPRVQYEEMNYGGSRGNNYFRILGAKYLICDECTAAMLQGYKHLENVAGYEIYETEDVLPHSYIVNQLNGEFLNLTDFMIKAATFDLSKRLLFLEPNVSVTLNDANDSSRDICIRREDIRTVNRSRFVVQCKSAGVLVMNEFFDKAWKITVDGVKTKSLKVNGNQIGAPFTSGSHIIEFRYSPKLFLFSLWLMFVGIVACVFLYWSVVKGLWKPIHKKTNLGI